MWPFYSWSEKLSVQDGCILLGSRVVIPEAGHPCVLEVLHQGYPEVSRMKSLARGAVWWPRIEST